MRNLTIKSGSVLNQISLSGAMRLNVLRNAAASRSWNAVTKCRWSGIPRRSCRHTLPAGRLHGGVDRRRSGQSTSDGLQPGNVGDRQIAQLDQLAIGQSLTFDYPAQHDSCILVRTGENNFVAFSQKCTHLSCAVVPEPEKKRFLCPCHNGSFDLETGKPLAGPPRRPLPRIRLEIVNGAIYAVGVEERMI